MYYGFHFAYLEEQNGKPPDSFFEELALNARKAIATVMNGGGRRMGSCNSHAQALCEYLDAVDGLCCPRDNEIYEDAKAALVVILKSGVDEQVLTSLAEKAGRQ